MAGSHTESAAMQLMKAWGIDDLPVINIDIALHCGEAPTATVKFLVTEKMAKDIVETFDKTYLIGKALD